MGQALLLAVLGLLGLVAYKILSRFWIHYRMLNCLGEDVYEQQPIGVFRFILSIGFWVVALVFVWEPIVFGIFLCLNACIFRGVIMRSSPEIGFRIMYCSFAMAMTVVFSLVGIVSLAAALVMNREARLQNRMRPLRQLQFENSMRSIDRSF